MKLFGCSSHSPQSTISKLVTRIPSPLNHLSCSPDPGPHLHLHVPGRACPRLSDRGSEGLHIHQPWTVSADSSPNRRPTSRWKTPRRTMARTMIHDNHPAFPGWSIAFSFSSEWPCYGPGTSPVADRIGNARGASKLTRAQEHVLSRITLFPQSLRIK